MCVCSPAAFVSHAGVAPLVSSRLPSSLFLSLLSPGSPIAKINYDSSPHLEGILAHLYVRVCVCVRA